MAEAPSHAGSEEQTLLLEGPEGLAQQPHLEDEEWGAQERRCQEGDGHLRPQDRDGGGHSPEPPEREKLLEAAEEADEEDEGFGDWSHKAELRQDPRARGRSPDGAREADRPCDSQGGDQLSPSRACLEGLCLHPDSEPQEPSQPEQAESTGLEETGQGGLGPTEAEDTEGQHQKCQQPRTPSPLALEEGTELGSPPLSPSTKLIDRTESLTRSIQKSNSVKRSQPALPIAKIDERLEQYTQAIETSGRTPKLVRQPSIELPSMAVADTKSRWETGEVQAQSAAKGPSCKDIVAGDMSKKSFWEQKGGSKTSSTVKSTPSGKRYKFVATGHGKYEKVLMDESAEP